MKSLVPYVIDFLKPANMQFFTRKNVSSSIGNIIEWYDFCLYGYFAPYIATTFFPNHNKYISLIAAFLAFAFGSIMRPLGGVIFGYIGDVYGTEKALYLSISLIAFPTFLIGLLPGFDSIGILAPIILVIFRLFQGISAGGQYSGSLTVLRKESGMHHGARGTSLAYIASVFGFFIASLVGFISTSIFHDQFAWRVPFLIAALFIPLLLWAKSNFNFEKEPQQHKNKNELPLLIIFKKYKLLTLRVIILASFSGIFYSSNFVFLISYMKVHVNMVMNTILLINTLCLISSCLLIYIFAKFVDAYGRKPVALFASISLAVLILPSFTLINTGNAYLALIGTWLLTTTNTAIMATFAVMFVELFPKKIRFTGCSLAYNLGVGAYSVYSARPFR